MPSSTSLLLSSMACASMIKGISGQKDSAAAKCPGVVENPRNGESYCCIAEDFDVFETREAKTMECSTRISFTASDYDDQIKSARSKYSLQNSEATTTGDSDEEDDKESDNCYFKEILYIITPGFPGLKALTRMEMQLNPNPQDVFLWIKAKDAPWRSMWATDNGLDSTQLADSFEYAMARQLEWQQAVLSLGFNLVAVREDVAVEDVAWDNQ
ncbi:hypothetical protein FSARC_2635 [Fusarium sarcochroum]|uniref:Uncharacterized protein n=1 Tax=Fusarium sarcochroum TaxID=1208366 RepID=A0A8H4U692_9HYPO|nr:hypothetical protein FSARC_2635 [Fusarium sarcochroum]